MKYVYLICLIFCVMHLSAQEPIDGLVLNAQTREPIAGATVQCGTLSCSTDENGHFRLLNPGEDSLTVSSTGYYARKIGIAGGARLLVLLEPSLTMLNEVVVSGSRQQESRKEVPLAISRINAETVRDTRATGIYQLLNKVSGVYMVDLGNEQHTMAIRQPIGYNALYLYLEDGLPIRPTGLFNHNALYEINMNALSNIEVIKGPASSLYGSNSIGGAVNFSTLRPPMGTMAELSLRMGAHNYQRIDLKSGLSIGKLGIIAAGYASRQRDSWQDYTDFDKYSASLTARYIFNAGTGLAVSASYNDLDTQTPGTLDSIRFYNRSYSSNQRFTYRKVRAFRASTRLDHTWNDRNSSFVTVFARTNSTGQLPAYFIQDIRDSEGQHIRSLGQENEQRFHSLGMLMQHQTGFDFLSSRLIGGISIDDSPSSFVAEQLLISKDVSRNYYTGYTPAGIRIDDYKIRLFNAAAYLQYEMQPLEALKFVAALRYDLVQYKFRNLLPPGSTMLKSQERNRYSVLAPRLGATYNLSSGAGLYANFSMGFQPPETSGLYNSRQLEKLKEATFLNYELGGWIPLISEKLHAELSLYLMEGRNEIISVLMPDNSIQNANAGATRHSGIEYSLNFKPHRQWSFRLSGTNARHQYLKHTEILFKQPVVLDGHDMPNAPKWIANSEIAWKNGDDHGLRAALEWQHIGKYFVNGANTRSYDGYDLLNFRTGYKFRKSGLNIWLNLTNLSDELYANTVTANAWGSNYNAAAPRAFSLGIAYSFHNFQRP